MARGAKPFNGMNVGLYEYHSMSIVYIEIYYIYSWTYISGSSHAVSYIRYIRVYCCYIERRVEAAEPQDRFLTADIY